MDQKGNVATTSVSTFIFFIFYLQLCQKGNVATKSVFTKEHLELTEECSFRKSTSDLFCSFFDSRSSLWTMFVHITHKMGARLKQKGAYDNLTII